MTNGTTYSLDVQSVEFCKGWYCRSTLKVDREDAAEFEFQKHEIDYIDGPSTKVLWLNSCSLQIYRDRFFVGTKNTSTSDYYVFWNCGEDANPNQDFYIEGTEVGTGGVLKLYTKDIDFADFP